MEYPQGGSHPDQMPTGQYLALEDDIERFNITQASLASSRLISPTDGTSSAPNDLPSELPLMFECDFMAYNLSLQGLEHAENVCSDLGNLEHETSSQSQKSLCDFLPVQSQNCESTQPKRNMSGMATRSVPNRGKKAFKAGYVTHRAGRHILDISMAKRILLIDLIVVIASCSNATGQPASTKAFSKARKL